MTGAASATAPPEAGGADVAERAAWVPRDLAVIIAVCVVLGAISAAVLPTVPSYDPWSWITWGREVFDSHLSFVTGGGPSWKPLPVLFTAVYGLFGGAGPTLWVITARIGGLLGIVAAWRLGARLAARPALGGAEAEAEGVERWLPALAGVVAALAVALTNQWTYYMLRGTSEPMLIATCLWSIDRFLAGRRGSAFVLLTAAAQIRPEAWPFLGLYGLWLLVREPRLRGLVVLGWLSLPVLWFVPPWIGSGQPFLAASHAKSYNGHLGSSPFVTVVGRGLVLQIVPALVLGALAVVLGWWRGRDRIVLGLAACAFAWWALVVAMTLAGYPGLDRFFLPAAAVTCVLAGAGVVAIGRLAAGVGRGAGRPGVALAVALVLVAGAAAVSTGRIAGAWNQHSAASRAAARLDSLSRAAAAVGGHDGVFPCRSSVAAINHGVQTALAWKLHVTLLRVTTSLRHPGLLFVGPHDPTDGGPAPVSHRLDVRTLLTTVGPWKIYRVSSSRDGFHCVGR